MTASNDRSTQGSPVELRGVVWTIWLAAAAVALSATGSDPDLWGHVRFGLDWWQTFSLPSVDPYSFTQDRPWINHEWLSEAIMGAAYRLGGVAGLILVKLVVIAAALVILARRLRGTSPLIAVAALSLAIAGALPISLTVRPQLWSLLGLTCLAALLSKLEEEPAAPSGTAIASCALLFTVWANLHGGWITGAGVLLVYAAVSALQRPRSAARLAALVLAGLAGTLINPYGLGLWRFLVSTVRGSRPDITEWQSMAFDSPLILWVPIVGTVVLVGVLSSRERTRPPAAILAVLLLLVGAALRVHRIAPLLWPAGLVLLAPGIRQAWGAAGVLRVADRKAAMVIWVPAIVALTAAAGPVIDAFGCMPIKSSWAPDTTVTGALQNAQGRLWTTFDWGEYAIWHFGPELKVSIDGRRETVYSDSVVQMHREFERGDPEAQRRFLELSPGYVWLPASRTHARDWLSSHGYRIDIQTPASFIAVRRDLDRLTHEPAEGAFCFP